MKHRLSLLIALLLAICGLAGVGARMHRAGSVAPVSLADGANRKLLVSSPVEVGPDFARIGGRRLSLVTRCLKAARGEDNAMIRRFRKEELAGATTRAATQPEPISQTMSEISIDPSPYAAAISQLVSDDDQTRQAKGNLLLLAGRSEEARQIFEALERSSDASDRVGLAENVARAIKASDGTIGRANGYMLNAAIAVKPE